VAGGVTVVIHPHRLPSLLFWWWLIDKLVFQPHSVLSGSCARRFWFSETSLSRLCSCRSGCVWYCFAGSWFMLVSSGSIPPRRGCVCGRWTIYFNLDLVSTTWLCYEFSPVVAGGELVSVIVWGYGWIFKAWCYEFNQYAVDLSSVVFLGGYGVLFICGTICILFRPFLASCGNDV